MMDENLLCFNGIDGASGEYLLPPQPAAVISAVAREEEVDMANLEFLKRWWERVSQADFAPTSNVDPRELSSAGWGVIFADDVTQDSPIYQALAPLLEHRRRRAAQVKEHYYKEFLGPQQKAFQPSAYWPNETKQGFLARHGAGPGAADPALAAKLQDDDELKRLRAGRRIPIGPSRTARRIRRSRWGSG
jgi:hypothetical protein